MMEGSTVYHIESTIHNVDTVDSQIVGEMCRYFVNIAIYYLPTVSKYYNEYVNDYIIYKCTIRILLYMGVISLLIVYNI